MTVEGMPIETTEDGFLRDSSQWSEAVARMLAARIPLELTEAHWEIIRFIRDYHARFRHLPNNRMFVKAVGQGLSSEKGNSPYLNRLFKGSPVKYACLLAGLPKPPGCI